MAGTKMKQPTKSRLLIRPETLPPRPCCGRKKKETTARVRALKGMLILLGERGILVSSLALRLKRKMCRGVGAIKCY